MKINIALDNIKSNVIEDSIHTLEMLKNQSNFLGRMKLSVQVLAIKYLPSSYVLYEYELASENEPVNCIQFNF
jgi:hypothetical protein